jgi:pSer/pThr/pTyr-binding forkhead associated (FHA) protein
VAIGAGVTVGRGEGCEVRFQGRKDLSRRHFEVRAVKDYFVVADLDSNSTSIEGVPGPVYRRELREGDVIRADGILFLIVR